MIQDDGTADGSDFRLRASRPDETGLSVNWLEAFEPGKVHQLAEVRRLCRLRLSPRGRFAEMNVGTVLREVATELGVAGNIAQCVGVRLPNTVRQVDDEKEVADPSP